MAQDCCTESPTWCQICQHTAEFVLFKLPMFEDRMYRSGNGYFSGHGERLQSNYGMYELLLHTPLPNLDLD
jgi:hypothetical protein